jgi:hypothetical protein
MGGCKLKRATRGFTAKIEAGVHRNNGLPEGLIYYLSVGCTGPTLLFLFNENPFAANLHFYFDISLGDVISI